jgi:hypothetical protein
MIEQLTVQEIEICNGGKIKKETITPLTAGCYGTITGLIASQVFCVFAGQGLGARERLFYSAVIWGAVGAFVYKTTVGIVRIVDDEEYHDYPGL